MKKHKLFLKAFFVAILIVINSGCTYFIHNKTVHVSGTTPDVSISYTNGGSYKKAGVNSGDIKVDWRSPLVLKQECDGYQTSTHVIKTSQLNPVKILDFAGGVIGVIIGIKMSNSPNEMMGTYGFGLAFYSALLPFYCRGFTHYPSQVNLPGLKEIPTRDSSERYLEVKKTDVDIKSDSLIYYTYKNFRKMEKHKPYYTNYGDDSFDYSDTDLKHDMNDILGKIGFADTSNKLFKNSFNCLYINSTIKSLKAHAAYGSIGYITMTFEFSLHEMNDEKELFSKRITATSEYILASDMGDDDITESILRSAIYQFIECEEIRPFMVSQEDKLTQQVANYEELNIKESVYAANKSEAISSVVTIKRDKSHGSGCVISSDGYIITNYHVTGPDESKLKVLLENGSEVSCKLLRVNQKYDLALLKIDPIDIKPLKVITSKEILVGEEVFAIGTPADIELGQSISKGIISGKRKNEDLLYIQTDVSVNPGNSGGALINSKGELIGIINAKLSGVGIEGIGFAIPAYYIEEALKIKF